MLGTDYNLNYSNGTATIGNIAATSSTFSICAVYDESGGWGGTDWRNTIFIDPNDIHGADKTITLKITEVSLGKCTGGNTAFDRFESDTLTTTIVNTDGSSPPVTPLATTSSIAPVSLDKSASGSVANIESFFTGGTGTVTYSAVSAALDCVTVSAITQSSGAHTLPITATAAANACSSLITVTATDSTTPTPQTQTQTFTVYTPKLKFTSGASITNQDLTRGEGPTTITDVSQHFEGGIRPDIAYSTLAATTSITPALSATNCVTVTQPDGSNNFTITPHNDQAVTNCTATVSVRAYDGDRTRTATFTATVTPPVIPITVTSAGNFAGSLPTARGEVIMYDLTTYFAGGTGTLTYTASSSDTSCVATNVTGTTLTTTAHLDSAIAGECTSTIKATATDTTSATKDTPGFTVRVVAPTLFNLSGANTLSSATLARGASSAVFDLTDYIEGGNGDITYSATTDDNTCVTFAITGADFTYTAHNTAAKTAQCVANIVVTATDSHAPTPQTIDTDSFAITVPAVTTTPSTPPATSTPLALSSTTLDAFISIAGGTSTNAYDLTQYFTGGTGNITYAFTSDNDSCVTATIDQAADTIIFNASNSNTCSAAITIKATDSATPITSASITGVTVGVHVPVRLTAAAPDTAQANPISLTQGTARDLDVSGWFQGSDGDFGGWEVRVETEDATVATCVTPTIEFTTLTLTPHNTNTNPTCTIQIRLTVADEGGIGEMNHFFFWITVPAVTTTPSTPPANPITVTGIGSVTGPTGFERGLSFPIDLTTWFSGGTGALTFSATSSNTNCVAINVAGNTLTITTHLDSTIAGQCTSTITVTATDTTGATKDTPGFMVLVVAPTPFTLSGANTLSDATLARGASSSVFDLSNYINGGGGDITYSATTDDDTCVDFTLTGADFTLTAHNTAAKTAQCVANIVVTATDGHLPVPQTIDTDSFAITVPAVTTTPSTPPTTTPTTPNPLRLTANGNIQTNFVYGRSSSNTYDLTTWFSGGTGTLTYTVTSSNPSCITVDVAGATLTTTTHKDSTIIEECSSLIRITATDSTSPTPQTITTPGFTERVFALNLIRYGESGDSTFSNISLQRGASNINAINLNDYFSGGLDLFAYTVTSSNQNCVSFTLTGDDSNLLTLTAHNDANRAAQCSSNIVVTATTSIEVPPQVLSAPPFTVTVPAIPLSLRASPTTRLPNITLVEGRSTTVQNLFQYFQRGTTPYTFTASTDDTTNCAQNTATINANTLTLTAHTDNAGECASTLVTVTATDTAGDTATQTLTLTVRDPSTSSGGGGGGSSRRSFRASNVEFETITLSEGETHTIENLDEYFIHGSQPYSYAVTNHTQSKCEENEVDIHRDTLTLQATDTYSLSCSQTDLTITATDNKGRDVERDLSFTIEKTQHTDTPEKAITTTQQSFTPQKATQQTQQEQTTQTLSFGSTHPEVQTLQQFLNKQSTPIAQTGPGSPGQETTYFGTATQRALKAYQQSKNIPQTGVLDETTKTAIAVDNTIEMLIVRILTISMQIVELQIQELQEKAQ